MGVSLMAGSHFVILNCSLTGRKGTLLKKIGNMTTVFYLRIVCMNFKCKLNTNLPAPTSDRLAIIDSAIEKREVNFQCDRV